MLQGGMADAFTAARKRQLARLGGAKPPAPRAAMALARSQAYQDAADAPATLRAYTTDLANYTAWRSRSARTICALASSRPPTGMVSRTKRSWVTRAIAAWLQCAATCGEPSS